MDKMLVGRRASRLRTWWWIPIAVFTAGCTSEPPRRITVALGQTCDEMEAIEPGLGAFCERAAGERKAEAIAFRLLDPKTRRTLVAVDEAAVSLGVTQGRVSGIEVRARKEHGTAAERRANAHAVVASLGADWSCDPSTIFDALQRPDAFELDQRTGSDTGETWTRSDCRAARGEGRSITCNGPSGSYGSFWFSCDPEFSWGIDLRSRR